MTEDEAKKKWCPFVRLVGGNKNDAGADIGSHNGSAFNRVALVDSGDFSIPHAARCIASDCMAWRVSVVPPYQENVYNREEAPEGEGWQPSSPGPRNRHWWRTIPEQRIGFCGLAGAPQ